MLGFDLDSWNAIMLWSLGGAALAAFSVVVSTAAVLKLQKVSEEAAKTELDTYKLGVEARVADAKTEGIKAGEAAGNALVRAAELEKEAANARLETERIKSVVAWRTLEPVSVASMLNTLKQKPGAVNLRFTDGDPESLFLAIQFSKILEQAGWKVAAGSEKTNGFTFGVSLPDPLTPDMQTLREALTTASIPFSTQAPRQTSSSVSFNVASIQGAPTMRVGSRPPPKL